MNLRDLMTRLDHIAEESKPPSDTDLQRAAYDKFKSDDAKSAAIADVKKIANTPMNQIPRFGIAINPKTGQIFYGDDGGEIGTPQPKGYPFKWMQSGGPGESQKDAARIRAAGLQIIDKGGYAYVDPKALVDIDKPTPAPAPAPGPTPVANDDAKKLEELIAQLEATIKGDIAPMPTPGPTPGPTPKPKNKSLNWKELALATGASAIPGAVVGGLPGAAVTGLAGGGTDLYHQLYREGTEFNSGIAQSLVESFGYQLDELADNPNLPGFMRTKYNVADPLDKPLTARGSAGANVEAGRASYKAPELPAAEVPKAEVPKAAPNFSGGQMQGNVSNVKYAAPEMKAASTGVADIAKTAPAAAAEAPKIAAGLQKAGVPIAKSAEEAAAQVAAKAGAKAGGKMLSKLIPGVGLVVGTVDAIKRAQEGDWTGAGIAGVSAALSLVPGVGGAVSMGLDAANLARDYKAGKFGDAASPTGTTGGDAKLMQLQKIIGAKPDGMMGPETKQKLVAWQQSQGLTPDGLPGPATYGKAGIKESQQTVAEGIRSLQERLQLIETKAAIRETLEQRYYLDEYYYMYNGIGEQVTDLTTISVINDAYEKGEVEIVEGLGSALWNMGKDAVKGAGKFIGSTVKGGASPAAAERLAKMGGSGGKALSSAEKAGLKTGAAIAKNPIKAGLGATALGIGGAAALSGDDTPEPTTTGGGGDNSGIGSADTGTTTGDTPTTTPDASASKVTPEQQAIIDKIRALEKAHDPKDVDPAWTKAVAHGDQVIAKVDHSNSSNLDPNKGGNAATTIPSGPGTAAGPVSDADKKKAAEAAATSVAGEKKAADKSGTASSPAGTTTDNSGKFKTSPSPVTGPDGKDLFGSKLIPSGTTIGKDGTSMPNTNGVKESYHDELARWLKIARG